MAKKAPKTPNAATPAKEPAPPNPGPKKVLAAEVITRVCGMGIVPATQLAETIGADSCSQIETIYAGNGKAKSDAIRVVIGKATQVAKTSVAQTQPSAKE